MKKTEVLNELDRLHIPYAETITDVEAKILLKQWQESNIKSHIVTIAEQEGHRVLFTPPHYSDLQPIEMEWASIKIGVAEQYNRNTTLKDVRNRLEEQFDLLLNDHGQNAVSNVIDHVDKTIVRFLSEIDRQEEETERQVDKKFDSVETRSDSSISRS